MILYYSFILSVLVAHTVAWPTDLPGHGLHMKLTTEHVLSPRQASPSVDIAKYQAAWQPAGPADLRSPCPALNTAANVGALPRNGRNISAEVLAQAVQDLYNLDKDFANTIASGGIALVTPPLATDQTISLLDLARHGAIEHDSSLARLDARQGDAVKANATLVARFLADAGNDEYVTLASMSRTRARREKESIAAGGSTLGPQDTIAAYGEAALVLHTLGHLGPKKGGPQDGYYVPKKAIEEWFLEEKLPTGYTRPELVTTSMAVQIGAKILAAQSLSEALIPASK